MNNNGRASAEWTSPELERLTGEIAQLNERYISVVKELYCRTPGSDEFVQRWAELDVLLEWLQKKVSEARQEIARLEEAWPGSSESSE
jgi:chromosome segregation ATPase